MNDITYAMIKPDGIKYTDKILDIIKNNNFEIIKLKIEKLSKKENAVKDFRNLIGETDPKKAKEGTIRSLYGTQINRNVIHGSDSNENALKEITTMFKKTT